MDIHTLRLGQLVLPSNVLMAPLAGYTCYPFRILCQELGGRTVFYGDGQCQRPKI